MGIRKSFAAAAALRVGDITYQIFLLPRFGEAGGGDISQLDHSVQVDQFGSKDAFSVNALLEFQRNRERYILLRWGQTAFKNFRVVPPDTGIVHQVNLEYLASVVFRQQTEQGWAAYPDTLVG